MGLVGFVGFFVEFEVEELEVVADFFADIIGFFAKAAGEDDGVEAAERGGVGAAVFGDLVGEDFDCEEGFGFFFEAGGEDFAHVGAEFGEGEEAGLFVEEDVGWFDADFAGEFEDDAGVDRSAACAHGDAFERAEAHAIVDGLSVFAGGD